jgi:hypothetical protein
MPRTLVFLAGSDRLKTKKVGILKLIGAAIVIFVAAFSITNPYALGDSYFYRTVLVQADWMSIGHGKVEPKNPVHWLPVLSSELGLVGVFLLLVGTSLTIAHTISNWRRRGWRASVLNESCRNMITLLSYLIGTTIYLAVAVRLRYPRYTFHIIPFWLVVSLWGFQHLYCRWPFSRINARHLSIITAFALILFSAVQAEESIAKMGRVTSRSLSPAIEAANFISENYSGDTRILAERYSYVLPKFVNTRLVWGINQQELQTFEPQLIVLNKRMSGRWIWKAPGSKFNQRDFVIDQSYGSKPMEVKLFWESLFNNDWTVLYENAEIVILGQSFRKKGS